MKFIDRNNFDLKSFQISAEEYLLKIKERPKPIVLDIRESEELKKGGLEGAYSLPHNEVAERMIQLPPFGTIILYSDHKNSHMEKVVKLLSENGFTDLLYVDGGQEAISAAMFEVEEGIITKYKAYLSENNATGMKLDVNVYEIKYELVNDIPDAAVFKHVNLDGVNIFFEHRKLRLIEKTAIKWENGKPKFDHPRMHKPKPKESVEQRIKIILDDEINPAVSSHGGAVKLIKVDGDTAYIEMAGGCQGCGMSAVTLKNGIEAAILDRIPEISEIVDATDHESGENPFYKSTVE